MKKRMIIVTALIMGTLGAGCVSVQASDTLPELTKDNALEQKEMSISPACILMKQMEMQMIL